MNRFKIFTCFTLLTLVFTSYRVKAQDMTYTLDTLRNRMFPYNLVVAAGATVDLNISGHSSA